MRKVAKCDGAINRPEINTVDTGHAIPAKLCHTKSAGEAPVTMREQLGRNAHTYVIQPHVDQVTTRKQLKSSWLNGETEQLATSAHGESLLIDYYQEQVIKVPNGQSVDEHIDRIISDSPTLSPTEYTRRHYNIYKKI